MQTTAPAGLQPADPAEAGGTGATKVDGVDVLGALSPSRVGDFLSCPLLFRFRTIDRLPEAPSPAAVRGTVVHRVLEQLFDLPASERTPERAAGMIDPAWSELQEVEPALAAMFPVEGPEIAGWLVSCRETLARYFELEDPRRLEPAERELYVETLTDTKLLLRGVVDRVDVAPDGAIRVVDYKGLAVDTPLPTPTGWTTMGDVQIGDQLIGSNGEPTTVTTKSGVHRRPCFRVTFRDGSSVVCDNVHLWSVVSTYRQEQTRAIVDANQLAGMFRKASDAGRPQSLWVEAAHPLSLPDRDDLAIDPWILGAWLGDGDSRGGALTVGHDDIADMVVQAKARWHGDVLVRPEGASMRMTFARDHRRCAYGHDQFKPRPNAEGQRRCAREGEHNHCAKTNVSLAWLLRRGGLLHNKRIPQEYLRAGTQQRIELLRGLMDTDGWWNRKRRRAGFTTTSDRLAADVVELLRSLGIHPQHFEKPYTNKVRPGRTWHVIEFTPVGFNPFALPRKATPVDTDVTALQASLARRRVIASVDPVPSVPTQCVAVDAEDSLYLCGDGMVPTHNTGSAPGEMFEAKALFQLKFYALVLWRTRGVVPKRLQLIYLGDGQVLTYDPDESELLATERKVQAVWQAIRAATEAGDFQARRGSLCAWCSHQALCPEFGGTPPPLPSREAEPTEVLD